MSVERIPIQNIYFLLCYALDHVQETHYAEVRSESCDRAVDLLAKVLTRSAQQLVKRGLHRDYVPVRELRNQPKGKILVAEEIRRPVFGSLARTCEFDELSADILPNRIIRSTLEGLLASPDVKHDLRHELRDVFGFFESFARVRLDRQIFRRVHVHRNMRHYRFVLDICAFVHGQLLPDTGQGPSKFRDFRRDEACMGKLFEHFIRNFYASEQNVYRVTSPQVQWVLDEEKSSVGGLRLLPQMQTDIRLESPTDKVIIDCKFYTDAFQRNFDRQKFISGHLYQLFAYLKNQEKQTGWEAVRGMLLYPVVEGHFDEMLHLSGHSVRIASINLGQQWRQITEDLLTLLGQNLRSLPSP